MSRLYGVIICACLSLGLKIILIPDWATVAALFVFAASGLAVYFLEDKSENQKARIDKLYTDVEGLVNLKDRLAKLETHVERVDNRTRPVGR